MVTLTRNGPGNADAKHGNERAADAQRLLHASPYHSLRTVVCQSRDNMLVLSGRVESFHLKQLAQETVRPLVSEQMIANLLTVD